MAFSLTPHDPVGLRKVRVGNGDGDGGYVMIDDFSQVSGALSIGVGGDASWDLEMADRGIPVHQYDHTVEGPPISHPLFRFRKTGVGVRDTSIPSLSTLGRMVERVPQSGDIILKMDVEGAEWEALGSTSRNTLRRFSQIIIELHYPMVGTTLRRMQNLRILRSLLSTHAVVHLHANNYGGVGDFDGLKLPNVLEATYLRRRQKQFSSFAGSRTDLDRPNDPSRPDIEIDPLLWNF